MNKFLNKHQLKRFHQLNKKKKLNIQEKPQDKKLEEEKVILKVNQLLRPLLTRLQLIKQINIQQAQLIQLIIIKPK